MSLELSEEVAADRATVQEIKQLIALLEKILDQSAQQMPESKL
jgi:hypothetical protein